MQESKQAPKKPQTKKSQARLVTVYDVNKQHHAYKLIALVLAIGLLIVFLGASVFHLDKIYTLMVIFILLLLAASVIAFMYGYKNRKLDFSAFGILSLLTNKTIQAAVGILFIAAFFIAGFFSMLAK